MKLAVALVLAVALGSTTTAYRKYVKKSCNAGDFVYDKCGQRCICTSSGKLIQCTRIRKEFTSMTTAERIKYIKTVKKASTDERYLGKYEKFLKKHHKLFARGDPEGIHGSKHFLPWHRWYILEYENLMREINCNFTVAYWDWSAVAGSPWGTSSSDLWYSGGSGFGGNGEDPNQCVRTGPFRKNIWQLRPSYTDPKCLRRYFNLTATPFSAVQVEITLRRTPEDFADFECIVREEMHDNVHCFIGATMCGRNAAAAPEFFLHHSMVDKIWEDWQKRSNARRTAYFPTIGKTMPGTSLLPGELIHNTALPGNVRIEYATTEQMERITKKLRKMSIKQLKNVPTVNPSPLSKPAMRLFKITMREAKRMARLMKKIFGRRVQADRRPTGPVNKKLGFDPKTLDQILGE